jgi:hypothetical protein
MEIISDKVISFQKAKPWLGPIIARCCRVNLLDPSQLHTSIKQLSINMSQLSPCPEPPVVERDGCSLTKERFCASIGNVERVSGSRLHELFLPETLRLKRDQKKASDEARELFERKGFFVRQLRHYGISFHPWMTKVGEQRELLMNAVAQGQVSQLILCRF